MNIVGGKIMQSIRSKIFWGVGVVVLFVVLQSVITWWSSWRTSEQVKTAINHNFAAVLILSDVVIEAQKLRRYEKEMFIYAAVKDKREGYVKEWEAAYKVMLDKLINSAADARKNLFTPEETQEMKNWLDAAQFYEREFRKTIDTARAQEAAPPASLTIDLNNAIGPGKDRFRVLLNGALKMREAKEKDSVEIMSQINTAFAAQNTLALLLAIAGLAVGALMVRAVMRSVTHPLRALTEATEKISKGLAEKSISQSGIEEYSPLEAALERLRVAQKAMVERISRSIKPA
jgi:HAMP domain-containing protein